MDKAMKQSQTKMSAGTMLTLLIIAAALTSANSEPGASDHMVTNSRNNCEDFEVPCGKCCCLTLYDDVVTCSGMSSIPPLPGNRNLSLTIINSKLHYITKTTFTNVSNRTLIFLAFINARIVNISSDAFTNLHHLKTFQLRDNRRLSNGQLKKAMQSLRPILEDLTLENIAAESLINFTTQGVMVKNIKYFNMKGNFIKNIDLALFENMHAIQRLNLADNWIDDIYTADFRLPYLRNLFLARNEISQNPPKFCASPNPLPELVHLDLSMNSIIIIQKDIFSCLPKLTTLELHGNDIKYLASNVFSTLTSLEQLDISDMGGKLKRIHPLALNVSTLHSLNISKNNLDLGCHRSLFNYSKHIERIDVSWNKFRDNHCLSKILEPLKSSLKYIEINGAGVNKLPKKFIPYFSGLRYISIRHNKIENLDRFFINMTSLRELKLNYNKIKGIYFTTMNRKYFEKLRSIDLSGNPFDCTCDLLEFRSGISESGYFGNVKLAGWPDEYVCNTPRSMKGQQLQSYHPTVYSCSEKPSFTVVYVVVGTFSGIFFTLIVSLLLYRNRWYITYWMYKKSNKPNDPERRSLLSHSKSSYDGYVIYDDDDRDFVHNDLLNTIETDNNYSLHVWHRDAESGAKLEVMVDAIYASHAVLAVVSNNFLRNSWCQFQLNVALDRDVELAKGNVGRSLIRSRIILVVLEDIDYQVLSQHWCVLLTRLNNAKWSSRQNGIMRRVFEHHICNHMETVKQYSVSSSYISLSSLQLS